MTQLVFRFKHSIPLPTVSKCKLSHKILKCYSNIKYVNKIGDNESEDGKKYKVPSNILNNINVIVKHF